MSGGTLLKRSSLGLSLFSAGLFRPALLHLEQIRLHLPVQLDRQRPAVAVHGLSGLHPDPAFRDAIFLDVAALAALEADADAAAEQLRLEIRAAGIHGQSVGKRVGHS